jgi:uncharacterized protein (DUF305 family)
MFLTPSQRFFEAARCKFFVFRSRPYRARTLAVAAFAAVAAATAIAALRDAAMAAMMKGMHVPPSGNVDRDFAVMMIAHHQGAIDMALAESRHGRNERLRRMAQEIVVEQRQEIVVMQAVLGEELPIPAAAGTSR